MNRIIKTNAEYATTAMKSKTGEENRYADLVYTLSVFQLQHPIP